MALYLLNISSEAWPARPSQGRACENMLGNWFSMGTTSLPFGQTSLPSIRGVIQVMLGGCHIILMACDPVCCFFSFGLRSIPHSVLCNPLLIQLTFMDLPEAPLLLCLVLCSQLKSERRQPLLCPCSLLAVMPLGLHTVNFFSLLLLIWSSSFPSVDMRCCYSSSYTCVCIYVFHTYIFHTNNS